MPCPRGLPRRQALESPPILGYRALREGPRQAYVPQSQNTLQFRKDVI
jgi:hypothetical protein